MAKGCDYSFDKPSAASLKAAGYRFACRYVGGSSGKRITSGEAKTLWAHGIDVVTNFEAQPDGPMGGYSQGYADAKLGWSQARSAGMPGNKPIYFSVDFDVQSHQMSTVAAYIRGATDYLGKEKTGVYGGIAVVRYCLDHELCKYAWQTYAWSRGAWDGRAQIQQYHNNVKIGGGTIDQDRSMHADFGAWHGAIESIGSTGGDQSIGVITSGGWDPQPAFLALAQHLGQLGGRFAQYTEQIKALRK